jgi:radical SAM superfamily enzyme YgiQ (UPF0313 family)
MNVLIINPPNYPFSSASILIEPIDALNIASYIEGNGHNVTLIDMDIERINAVDLETYLTSKYDYALIVYDYHIPLHTDDSLKGVLEIARILKNEGIVVCICGKIATFKPELFIYKNSPIDIAIPYSAEDSFLNIVNQNICKQTPETFDINKLPLPNYNLVNLDRYIDVRSILSSRGCSNKCSFCHVPNFWGKWQGKKAELVVNEIENLVNNYNSKKIIFLDDNALVSKERMQKICEGIISRNIDVALGCLGSIAFFDKDLMELMFKAGFRWIHYGAESGSNKLLKQSGKNQSIEKITSVIQKTKEIGFRVRTSWILDLPNSTTEDFKQTLSAIENISSDEIRLHYLSLRLGTDIYNKNNSNDFSQYIHSAEPSGVLTDIDKGFITGKINDLIGRLEAKNYHFIRESEDISKLSYEELNNRNTKVISLCPLRYGIGWTK